MGESPLLPVLRAFVSPCIPPLSHLALLRFLLTCLISVFIDMALLLQEMLHRTIDVTITANLATQITQIIQLRIKG